MCQVAAVSVSRWEVWARRGAGATPQAYVIWAVYASSHGSSQLPADTATHSVEACTCSRTIGLATT